MPEYYTRDGDPFRPVYEVDREAETIRLVSIRFRPCEAEIVYPLRDHLPETFVRVEKPHPKEMKP
jgi:hypothetical protein